MTLICLYFHPAEADGCEFTKDSFGYRNEPSNTEVDYHDWAVVNGPSSSGEATGPANGYGNTTGIYS